MESLGPRTGRRMQVHPVLHDASSMGLDPYSGKTWPDDATRRVPGATLQHWYSAWMCAPRLYVMRPRLAFVWRLPEFLAGRSSSPSRRNRVTIHFSIPPRFDSRNDGLRPVVGWDVLAAQRSILSSGQKLQYSVCIFFLVGYCAESRLGRSSAVPLTQRKAPAALAVSPRYHPVEAAEREKWISVMHVPITRYEMQPAGSDRTERKKGRKKREQLGRRGTVTERETTRLSLSLSSSLLPCPPPRPLSLCVCVCVPARTHTRYPGRPGLAHGKPSE